MSDLFSETIAEIVIRYRIEIRKGRTVMEGSAEWTGVRGRESFGTEESRNTGV
jgi:hypothetical protein